MASPSFHHPGVIDKESVMVSRCSDVADVEASSMAEEFPSWPTQMKRKRSNKHSKCADIITKRRRINGSGIIWRITRQTAGGGGWKLSVHESAETRVVEEEKKENEKKKKQKEKIMAMGNPKKRLQCGGGLLGLKLVEMGVDQDNPVCLMRKTITRSDIDVGQHRLLLPKNLLDEPLLENMMTLAEKTRTREKKGLAVRTLDQAGREYSLVLKFVDSLRVYRIIGPDYTKLVQQTGFQVGRCLDLWLFRARMAGTTTSDVANELWMAVEVDDGENGGDGRNGAKRVQLDLGSDVVERRRRSRAAAGGRGGEEMEMEMEREREREMEMVMVMEREMEMEASEGLLALNLSAGDEEEMKAAALVTSCHRDGDVEVAALAIMGMRCATAF